MCSDSNPTILHILTRPGDEVAESVLRSHQAEAGGTVHVIRLAEDHPDYEALLEAIFAAHLIQVW